MNQDNKISASFLSPRGFFSEKKKGLIDAHCHLEYTDESVVKETSLRMKAVVTSVAHPKDAERMLKLVEKYDNIYLSLGMHPTEVVKFSDSEIENYIDVIKKNKNKIVAIGEVGLDRNWITDDVEHKRTKEVFLKFIELANQLNIPLVIHARNGKSSGITAMDETLELLQYAKVPVMMHCFSSYEHIAYCKEKGYFLSMNTILCKSKTYSKIAKHTPLELMVLETDAPWMDPKSSELINRPWNIEQSAEKIAELKGITKEEVLEATTKNAKKLFKL